jgi:NADH dehydrogenase/putative oxidoreductase
MPGDDAPSASRAHASLRRLPLSGAPAWWLWGAVHLAFLAGGRNRLSVLFDWFWAYLSFRSGTRLITGNAGKSKAGGEV